MSLFTRKELTIFLAVFLVVLIVSIGITIGVSAAKNKNRDTGEIGEPVENGEFTFEDFLIPEEYRQPYFMDVMPVREPMERWDSEMAERFSRDIPSIVLEIIREENTRRLLEGK